MHANTASAKGSAEYAVYLGNIITVESKVEKDLFIAGNNANISSDAEIYRDIYACVNEMKINASGARNIRFIGNTLDIRGITVTGDIYADANEIIMDKDTIIEGKITCYDYTIISGKDEATVNKIVEKESRQEKRITIWQQILNSISSAISLFVVLIILIMAIPKLKASLDKEPMAVDECLKTVAKGLFVLIIIPIACIFALFTGILAPASLITGVLYIILCYVSGGLGAYIVINKLMSKYSKKNYIYINLIIAVLLVRLVKLIPYVGSIVTFIFLLYGMGFVYKQLKTKKKA